MALDAIQSAFSVLFMGRNFARLLAGLAVTVRIALLSVILSIVLGILLGIIMTSKSRIVRAVCRVYLEFMRMMPQLVLLFIMYFGLTHALGIGLSGETASVIVFTLWGTAEMGDLVRGSIKSIPVHQYESSRAIGLTEWQVFSCIIMPQTVRRLLPLAMNLVTRMVKTTSLVVFVGVIEVVKVGQQIIEANRLTVPTAAISVYAVIFFMYFAVCYPLSLVASMIERWQKKNGV